MVHYHHHINNIITKIYIKELLSNNNKKLLYETQKLKKSCNTEFVWAKNGSIFLRQNEHTKPIRITSLDHLSLVEQKLQTELSGNPVNKLQNSQKSN